MLPNLGVHDSAWLPEPASGVRSVNFDRELSAWFEEVLAPPPTQRTEAVAGRAQTHPSVRIPFLIF
jgi:hypothetical protein